jgi:hypothetical protein
MAGIHDGEVDAKPNWRAFSESVAGYFEQIDIEALREAVEYISTHPPKKQIIRDGVLECDQSEPTTKHCQGKLT